MDSRENGNSIPSRKTRELVMNGVPNVVYEVARLGNGDHCLVSNRPDIFLL